MFIPYATHYTATQTGSTLKFVQCEQCSTEYLYQLERSTTGEGTSLLFLDNEGAAARAAGRAEAQLQQSLEKGIDVVPCPSCGWIQAHMIPKARRTHRGWMVITGACLTVGMIPLTLIGGALNSGRWGGPPTIPWPAFLTIAGLLVLAGIGLIVGKYILARSYDPNADEVDSRIRLGQARAIPRAEFERQVQEVLAQKAQAEAEAAKNRPNPTPEQASPAGGLQRVFCNHCQQTFFSTGMEKCGLCGEIGGLAPATDDD